MRTKSNVRRAVAASAVATAMLLLPGMASAAPPERVSLDLSAPTVPDAFLTGVCGSPISVTITATLEVTLWRNEAGLVTLERDRFPNSWRTFTATETGESVRVRFEAVSTWDYGAGAQIGSTVTVKRTGMVFHVPGATAIAGQVINEGGIVDRFDQGVPIIEDGGEDIRTVGHFPTDVDYASAICEALKL